MRQYFYIVAHTIVGDDQVIDKVFLQEHDAIRWGRTLASKHSDYSVALYKQEIARTATVEFVKCLKEYPKIEPGAIENFDWGLVEN